MDRLAQEGSARVLRSSFLFSISPTLVHFLQSFSALLSLTMPFTVVYILLALQVSFSLVAAFSSFCGLCCGYIILHKPSFFI